MGRVQAPGPGEVGQPAFAGAVIESGHRAAERGRPVVGEVEGDRPGKVPAEQPGPFLEPEPVPVGGLQEEAKAGQLVVQRGGLGRTARLISAGVPGSVLGGLGVPAACGRAVVVQDLAERVQGVRCRQAGDLLVQPDAQLTVVGWAHCFQPPFAAHAAVCSEDLVPGNGHVAGHDQRGERCGDIPAGGHGEPEHPGLLGQQTLWGIKAHRHRCPHLITAGWPGGGRPVTRRQHPQRYAIEHLIPGPHRRELLGLPGQELRPDPFPHQAQSDDTEDKKSGSDDHLDHDGLLSSRQRQTSKPASQRKRCAFLRSPWSVSRVTVWGSIGNRCSIPTVLAWRTPTRQRSGRPTTARQGVHPGGSPWTICGGIRSSPSFVKSPSSSVTAPPDCPGWRWIARSIPMTAMMTMSDLRRFISRMTLCADWGLGVASQPWLDADGQAD